ncbi:MAG: hypothetical protein ACTHYN_10220 [Marinobacter sp.]|uniref:hypothetical protein n=1 Tax=Marinobacter sp. TaxID=50741 RepID=UPI003F9728FD
MRAFQTIALVGITAVSISAQASVITFPESITFDINADPETFSVPFTGDLTEGFRYGIEVPTVIYTLENDTFFATYDGTGYWDGIMDFGLQTLFSARRPDFPGEDRKPIEGPLLDQVYIYSVSFTFHELLPCSSRFGLCGIGTSGHVNESVKVSFFDGSAQEVPTGPTAPLLLTGLVGLWLKRETYVQHQKLLRYWKN